MDERSNTTRTEKVVIAVSAAVVLTIAFLAVLDYSGNGAKWMGFNEVAETKETTNYDADRTAVTSIARAEDPQRSKTLWDWMQILVIPAAVAIGTFVLNQTAKRRDEAMQKAQREREEAIENQRAMDTALETYFDKMDNQISEHGLMGRLRYLEEVKEDRSEVWVEETLAVLTLIRTRTLTLLERLDARRKRAVMQFLSESGLIDMNRTGLLVENQPLLSLRHANFSGADLAYMDLSGKDLQGVDFRKATLEPVNLRGSDLTEANLFEAVAQWAPGFPEESKLEQQAYSLRRTTMPDGSVHD